MLCLQFFVIEGDYIQLREGAQKMVAANAAVAKVAAAAAASSPYSSSLPSVAVTPMAQNRQKKVLSFGSNNLKSDKAVFKSYSGAALNATANCSHFSLQQNQQPNGVYFGASEGLTNVKILSKPMDSRELNGPEARPSKTSVLLNGANLERSSMGATQNSGSTNGRSSSNIGPKQPGRCGFKSLIG